MLLPHIIEHILLPSFEAFALLTPDSNEIKKLVQWIIDGETDQEDGQKKILPSPKEIVIRLSKIVLNTIDEWEKLGFSAKKKLEPAIIPFVAQQHQEMNMRHGITETDTGIIIESACNVDRKPLQEEIENARRQTIEKISEKIKSEKADAEKIGRTISGIRERVSGQNHEHREDGRYSFIMEAKANDIDDEETDPDDDDRPTNPGTPDSLKGVKMAGP